jgi:hypothetical protein
LLLEHLAIIGFHSLLYIPYYLFVTKSSVLIIDSLFTGAGLLIGLAMLAGNPQAVRWAQIYLCLGLLFALAVIFLYVFHISPQAPHLSWQIVSDLLTPIILFSLLAWSRSKRFEP